MLQEEFTGKLEAFPIPDVLGSTVFPYAWGVAGPLQWFFREAFHGEALEGGSSGELGWHGISTAMVCPRKAWYYMSFGRGYLQDNDRETPQWAIVGTAVHAGLAQHYECLKRLHEAGGNIALTSTLESPAVTAIASVRKDAFSGDSFLSTSSWEKLAGIVLSVLEDYFRHYEAETRALMTPGSGHYVVSVEQTLRVPRPRLPTRTQRLDVGLATPQGVVYVDHKVTQKSLASAISVFSTDGQFDGYHELGRRDYPDTFYTAEVNVLSYKPKPTGGVSTAFGRAEVPYRESWDAVITRGLKIVQDIRRRIKRGDTVGPPGISSYPICFDWTEPCQFVTVCRQQGEEAKARN